MANNVLDTNELMFTLGDELPIDSIAFKRTICGSEIGTIESVCSELNAGKTAQDIASYPVYMQDEYYRNLVKIYIENRDDRVGEQLRLYADTCGPCSDLRLADISVDTSIAVANDSLFLVGGIDSVVKNVGIPGNVSFGTLFDPGQTAVASFGVLQNVMNINNSNYCTKLVDQIISNLSGCAATTAALKPLKDTLIQRFCANNNRISSLTYDSLSSIISELGFSDNDLCNAGLADLRRVGNRSGDFVKTGLLHYSPAYYEDMEDFVANHNLLGFLSGVTHSMTDSLSLCALHPFEQGIAKQIGATLTPSNCFDKFGVTVKWYSELSSNAVRLSFINPTTNDSLCYFLYPAADTGKNALNADFGSSVITGATGFQMSSLFHLYGFDKVSQTRANRNTILMKFNGTKDAVAQPFAYFMSAFNEDSDYNLMEADQKQYLNGIGCSELIQMAKEVIADAEGYKIRAGHPNFESFVENVMNYRNNVNFDFDNYGEAFRSCGLSDSIVIRKHIAHYKIRFPSTATLSTVDGYINTIQNVRGIGISDIKAYKINGYHYLLLDVFEVDTNLNATKAIMQHELPGGGSVLVYMPVQARDTVAQLLSTSFSPINQSALAAAFPGATITSDTCTVNYFIPGSGTYSTPGEYIVMVKSISSDFDYNHYVDSICRFAAHTAPMTAVFTHAESAVSAQYSDWQMTAWRNYVRGLTSTNHNTLVKQSKASNFSNLGASNGTYSFSSSKFSYNNARRTAYLNDLMMDHEPNSGTNYTYIKTLLQALENHNHSTYGLQTILKPTGLNAPINNLNAASTETRTFVCGDTTHFWVNHFDTARSMINVFVQLPDYLPMPRQNYELIDISKGFERDSVTYMSLVFRGQNGGLIDTMECVAYTNRKLGETYTIPSAFLSSHSQFAMLSDDFENCETRTIETLYPAAQVKYNLYIDSIRNALIIAFKQHVIDSLVEEFSVNGTDIKHGVTLYYYDLAGNLIKTVSPAGVKKLSVLPPDDDTINAHRLRNELASPLVPAHDKVTKYRYNAQNKVIETVSPDAAAVKTKYDKMGRAALSQDTKQLMNNEFTYFLYDNLSRVVETGTIHKTGGWPGPSFYTPGGGVDPGQVKNMIRREVTATIYDTASYKVIGTFGKLPGQDNIKNRVSCTKYYDIVLSVVDASKDSAYNNALHYSYDISGNVKTLVHDLRTVFDSAMRFKRVDYEYDLYSGKVTLVSYNRGKADQFYQRYAYDSDNRILDVHSSSNGIVWDRDAHYEYYDHGPLARMDLGEQRVQGVDYAYTINGWLKAINGVENEYQADMGEDGQTGSVMPQDVFSQRIDYFTGDYKAISDSNYFRELPATPKSLYNGNIAAIATALTPFGNIYSKYHYDPLQRIDRADYTSYDYNYASTVLSSTNVPDYASNYKYDPDGNLLRLERQGGTVPASMNGGTAISQHIMDHLTYRYTPGTNRLTNLQDSANTTAYKIDIPPLTGDTSLAHYDYDANGNMTKDLVSGLSNIDWNRFGKVRSITKLNGTKINFAYDPLGNRLAKEVVTYPATDSMVKLKTVYIRDAAGNSLAVYENKKEFDLQKLTPTAVASDPGIGFSGPVAPIFTAPLAHHLLSTQAEDPDQNLATMAMAVPQMSDIVASLSLLQNLIASLDQSEALALAYSIPGITEYALSDDIVDEDKLMKYLQPVMLSTSMTAFQTSIFSTLKALDAGLYEAVVESVPATETEKEQFPEDMAMLDAYNGMDIGSRVELTDLLASELAKYHVSTLPYIRDVLLTAYTPANTYADFISDVPDADNIFDELRYDASEYASYRYGQAEESVLEWAVVKDEFKYNSVLVDALSGGEVVSDADVLAAVLSEHFGDVVTMAETNGQGGTLAAAMKLALANIDADLAPVAWLKAIELLQGDRAHLAEHHIYGSSRLGMQKYLPGEYKWEYVPNQTAPFQSLVQPKPWYSLYGNDLFKHTVYNNSLATTNMGTDGIGVSTHVLGKRHYELTNHLGNVQATILDRTSPLIDTNNNNEVTGYHSEISTAQDYYPFGMYMPGRYLSDTDRHCVTMNHVVMTLKPLKTTAAKASTMASTYRIGGSPTPPAIGLLPKASIFKDEVLHMYHYNTAEEHEDGWVVQTNYADADSSVQYVMDLGGEPSELYAYFQVHMDTNQAEQAFGFGLEVPEGVTVEARVRQYDDESNESYYDLLEWDEVTTGDADMLLTVDKNAVIAGANTTLELRMTYGGGSSFASGMRVTMTTPYTYNSVRVPENRVVTICEDDDDYRFGYNGMEKDNEAKGLSNSMDFGARIYDSRLGRWLSLDPKANKYPAMSPYNLNLNNPIVYNDPSGKDPREGGTVLNISSRSMIVLGAWYVGVDESKSTLDKGKIRVINDLALFQKGEEVQTLMFGIDRLKPAVTKLLDKSQGGILRGFTNKAIKNSPSNSATSFMHAATSNSYDLKEYKYNAGGAVTQEVDRRVTNFGIKGFEAEVSYKEVFNVSAVRNNKGEYELNRELTSFTIYRKPEENKDYGKGGKFSDSKYIQSVDVYTKKADGSWDNGTHTEIGVNPRFGNTKTE